ncbi:HAMP domain-containing histidine kinase [Luteolibacter arcticus]|uniref:histidine kinase n=1 Tax=Luteolibacter arcticus TaxID=1581411 RepID=A0ABT3GPT3_9BACT|nr:HAMP domain-containing sensor histidine kinase [Luteolibacter arcticus]MCW1925540.1 HAMP domain-containing histidine kinase [Luteolibacter arcticus]
MRGLWITFGPMLAAAALVLWGGERLAKRTVEDRIPVDRARLFDFAAMLRGELDRLDRLYADHLEEIASGSGWLDHEAMAKRCENLVGLRTCSVFVAAHKESEISGKKPAVGSSSRIPEVIAEGEGGRIVSRNTVVLPKEVLEGGDVPKGWLPGPQRGHRVHWIRTSDARVVAFVIDEEELDQQLQKHFAGWLEAPLAPLREAGEQAAIEGPGGKMLLTPQGERTGPAAMVLPHRIGLGEWQVLAWDRLKTGTTHDTATLILAGAIACSLLLAGIFLQIQQGRALRLAEERVSFVNRVSHELGTPLTNILLNLDLAGRSLEARPMEAQKRLLLIHEEVRRLGRLVANVLTFSRSERKTLELTPVACVPDQVVEDMLAQFQPSLDRRKVCVEWQRGASNSTRLDPDALAQITGNLISNVEKYAASGGWLGLTTSMENDRLKLRVSDHGPGIPMRFREKIFDAFERVHGGVSEGSSGTGLGLAIARELARRMGGELVLLSSERGATFELDLPAPSHLAIVHSEVA